MVGRNVNINLFDFQEKAVINLIDFSTSGKKQVMTVKSPTGSGKTIILINYIDEYLTNVNPKTAFIWLCPGKGNLEEQSRQKMCTFAPMRNAQTLSDALLYGFIEESTTFINWELVTKGDNKAILEGERKNLFDRIAEAHRNGIEFIVVIDEEHSNNTAKARFVIDAFSAKHIIRMSATAVKNPKYDYYEIDEIDVINAGLITKALYVNEGLKADQEYEDDYTILLKLADDKRKQIAQRYSEIGRRINPLVLIQFENGKPETIKAVEQELEVMGYTYEKGTVSKWMSEEKRDIPDNLSENNAKPIFLLMKQAISTGWDCPRAKILVKLRDGMSEQFQIQTIGRIRRMPESIHYEDDLLDFCYVYTFDKEWKDGLFANVDKAYETRRLFLKEKCKSFTLEKEIRDLDASASMVGEREVLNIIYDKYLQKYRLTNNRKQNRLLLQEGGYIFGDNLISHVLQGVFVRTDAVGESSARLIQTKIHVNTSTHGIYLLHSVDEIKKAIGISTAKTKTVLERLFRQGFNPNKKIVDLETKEFYAFIINNVRLIKNDFLEVTAQINRQLPVDTKTPKTSIFHIPEQEILRFDPTVKCEVEFSSNAYNDYSSGFNTTLLRSRSEQLFEEYCENNPAVDWVYKNGDTGQRYFSVVYYDGLMKQWLFYPDYIVKKKDGTVWIIETKGGEHSGHSDNIDIQIENKFIAFKNYAKKHDLCWGFVRNIDNKLFIDNSEFVLDMSDPHWERLDSVFGGNGQ